MSAVKTSATPIDLLQLYALDPGFENDLSKRFRVHKWHDVTDRGRFAREVGPSIRAVVTGGHLGTEPLAGVDLPALEIVAINGVGYDKVDLAAARRADIKVTNTPDVLTEDVADLALGLYLAAGRRIAAADMFVRAGQWRSGGNFPLSRRVSGRHFGLVGMGKIAQAIARRLEGFGGEISYTARTEKAELPYRFVVELAVLASECDVLFICVPGGGGTERLIDKGIIDALGPQGFLINIARGSVVDEEALVAALADERLGGAALDVFAAEPAANRLLEQSGVTVLSPHVASATWECRRAMAALVLENLDAHFAGRPLVTAVT